MNKHFDTSESAIAGPTPDSQPQEPESASLAEIQLGIDGGVIPQSPAAAYKLGFEHGRVAGSASATKTPDIEIQLSNFESWQNLRGQGWVWPLDAMAALRTKLHELGDDIELTPCFAMTVGVKLPSGRMIYLDREGRETT